MICELSWLQITPNNRNIYWTYQRYTSFKLIKAGKKLDILFFYDLLRYVLFAPANNSLINPQIIVDDINS